MGVQSVFLDQEQEGISEAIGVKRISAIVIHGVSEEGGASDLDAMLVGAERIGEQKEKAGGGEQQDQEDNAAPFTFGGQPEHEVGNNRRRETCPEIAEIAEIRRPARPAAR